MKAMILAAGLGTRLRPWTLKHPKALVPVGGVPMLERVIVRLKEEGFDRIVVNVHHFAGQIIDFLNERDFGVEVKVSDETGMLLETGGGIANAAGLLREFGEGGVLVHNVDILSDAPLAHLMGEHILKRNDITLLTSKRESSRKLMFDAGNRLIGWHNIAEEKYRPLSMSEDFNRKECACERAFSGIYVIGEPALVWLEEEWVRSGKAGYPVMDFFLENLDILKIGGYDCPCLQMLDIGKPDAIELANKRLPLQRQSL